MDLVGAEGRRGGTRGGRGSFTWDSVKPEERSYYLGNSANTGAAGAANLPPSARRRAVAAGAADWYSKPKEGPAGGGANLVEDGVGMGVMAGRRSEGVRQVGPGQGRGQAQWQPAKGTTGQGGGYQNPFGGGGKGGKGGAGSSLAALEADAVRRREQVMLDAAVGGKSFSDAVRSALTEAVASGVDDGGVSSGADRGTRMRGVVTSEMRDEKAKRKAERALRREQRLSRRANRRDRDSSESEREGMQSRRCEESDRRRRRRERESDREEENRRSTRRPRSEDDRPDSDFASEQRSRRRQRFSVDVWLVETLDYKGARQRTSNLHGI